VDAPDLRFKPERVTLYCTWRPSALTTGLHGQVLYTHTHTHAQREQEKERERNAISDVTEPLRPRSETDSRLSDRSVTTMVTVTQQQQQQHGGRCSHASLIIAIAHLHPHRHYYYHH